MSCAARSSFCRRSTEGKDAIDDPFGELWLRFRDRGGIDIAGSASLEGGVGFDANLRGFGCSKAALGDGGLFGGTSSISSTLSKLETVVMKDCASPSISMGNAVLLQRSSFPISALPSVSGSRPRGVLDLLESGDWPRICSSSWGRTGSGALFPGPFTTSGMSFADCGREVSGVVVDDGSGDPSS